MKYQAEIGDHKHEIEVHRDGGQVRALIDGEAFDVEVSEPEPNVYLIKREGKIYETFVAPSEKPDEPKTIFVNGKVVDVRLIDPKHLRGSRGESDHGDGLAEIRTAMPGKLVRVLLETGTSVEKGDGVLVVEAMKMQNELKAPKAGVVKEIRFGEGDTVSAGDVLAIIE